MKRQSAKRELIAPRGGKRYIRRDEQGRIKESDDQGRSLSQDRPRKASKAAKSGQGDRGDRKPAAKARRKQMARLSSAMQVGKGAVGGLIATVPMTLLMFAWHRKLPNTQRYPLPPSLITKRMFGRTPIPGKPAPMPNLAGCGKTPADKG